MKNNYSIAYFHIEVLDEIESWPVDVLADYARIIELLIDYGPDLRLPHSRAMGNGLFELRPRGSREPAGRFIAFLPRNALLFCMPSSKKHNRHQIANSRLHARE